MRLILTIPHNETAVDLLRESGLFNVTPGVNSFGQQIDIITYEKDINRSNEDFVQQILPVLKRLLSLFVDAFIASIKEENFKNLLSSTLQLQSFRSYCNDLARELEPNADDDNPSAILALIKPKNINREFTLFPDSPDDIQSQLKFDKALWFTRQYVHFTYLKNHEYRDLVQECDEKCKPIPTSAQVFRDAYSLMTEFVTLEKRAFLSEAVTEEELTKEYSYKSFCRLSEGEETIDERLWHRNIQEIFVKLASKIAKPTEHLIQLTNIYEIIKSMSKENRENLAIEMHEILDPGLLTQISQQLVSIAASLLEISLIQCSQLTQDYIVEIKQALDFCNMIIPEDKRSNLNDAKCTTPLIKAAIKENMQSLETLNSRP